MVAGNVDSSVTLTFRVREQVTQSLARVEASLNRVGIAAANTGKFMAQNAAGFATAGLALLAVAGTASRLAVQFGILDEEQAKTLQTVLLVGSALAGLAGAVGSVGQLLVQTGVSAAGFGAALGTIATFALPVIVAVGALTIAIAALVKEFTEGAGASAEFVRNALIAIGVAPQHAQFLAGGAGEALRGQFERAQAGNLGSPAQLVTGGGTGALRREVAADRATVRDIIINAQAFVGDEGQARQFAKFIGRILQEEQRVGGFTLP